jgi:hypothetical protein
MPRFNRTNSLGRVFGIREDRAVLFAVTKPDPIYLESIMRICSVEGCGKKHFGDGLCHTHHSKEWKRKRRGEKIPKKCSVEGCERKFYGQGLCVKHWTQVSRYGKVLERSLKDPNEFILEGKICKIQVYNKNRQLKFQALIDCEDYERVKDYKWHSGAGQVISSNKVGLLARFIMGTTDPKIQVDHINHNRLDNRKENLRICTNAENNRNKKKTKSNTSGYKGVYWNTKTGKWIAQIMVDGKHYHLGCFDNIVDAATAYDQSAKKFHKEFSQTNRLVKPKNKRFKRIF